MTGIGADALAWSTLEQQVATRPAQDFIRCPDVRLSYAALAASAAVLAGRLRRFGIARGDIVPTFQANGGPAVVTWFALMRLGAIWAPINTEFRGEQLVNALNLTRASVLIVDAPFLESVRTALPALPEVRSVLVQGCEPPPVAGQVIFAGLEALADGAMPPVADVARADVATIQFTSGSTGVSKAVQLSHGYLVGQARLASRYFDMRPDDVIYCPFPLHHWDAAIGTVMGALVSGATVALGARFSASRFWDDIRAFDATMFDFMGATLAFLFDRPPSPRDREHRVRLAWGLPMPEFREQFEQRFGFPLIEGYGSTEGGVAVFQRLGETYPRGSCGRVAPEYALRIVDEDGNAVPAGRVGEILTRPHDPCLMMSGYLNMPEVNAELIRAGWYHSGDLGFLDAAGNLFFAGRKKDTIRRRGENISALEVERAIAAHPDVSEVAAFGVPSPYTEEDVAVAVVRRAGAGLSGEELRSYCSARMARYMVPAHFLFLEHLPRTTTEKVAKAELKEIFACRQAARATA